MSGVDPVARSLARASTDSLTRGRTLDTLRRSIARAGGRLPQVTAAPPTIADMGSAAMPAGWTDWGLVSAPGVDVWPGRFTLTGGAWAARGPGYGAYWTFSTTGPHTGNGTDPAANVLRNGGRARFSSFAPMLEIGVAAGSAGYRVKVDGEYVAAGPLGSNGAGGYIRLTWGDGTVRQLRHYELEFAAEALFTGIRSLTTCPPMPWPVADRLRMIVHGDSMVGTVYDTTPQAQRLHGDTAALIGNLSGQPDCWPCGVGGTGWQAPPAHTVSWFNDRVDIDVIAPAPDVIWEMGGLNDGAYAGSVAQQQALVELWLAKVTAALPNVVVFMTGPMGSNGGSNTNALNLVVRDAKRNAAAKFPRNVRFIDNLAAAWVTGTGKQGSANGTGTADWMTGTDGTHPTAEGHVANARAFVSAAVAAMEGWR